MISIKLNRKNPGGLKGSSKRLEALAGKEVAVGFPRGESVLGNPHYKNGASILLVAVANNYGLGVPRRAFMELAAEKIRKWFPEYMRTAMPDAEAGKVPIEDVLENAGSVGAQLVKEAIADGDWEENSEATKRKKGSDKPLIATDAMRQAATWHVRDRS